MGFKGYKLKHKLIVLQSFQDREEPSSVYAKSFEITLYISSIRSDVIRFDEMERMITRTLGRYSEKNIDQISPFNELEPTLENMGNVLYQLIKQDLARINTSLDMMDISESPVKTYVVNDANTNEWLLIGDKKIKISSLIVENIISQSILHLISDFDKAESGVISEEAAPQPEPKAELPAAENPKPKSKQISAPLEQKKVPASEVALSISILILLGAAFTYYLKSSGIYPAGVDIFGHLFKSDLLYQSIKAGDLYPLYTELWYNGIQPLRYYAPLPYYLLALLQFITWGDAVYSYLLFVFIAFVVGGAGWLLWGRAYNRMALCTFLAVAWFFLPDNVRVFFVEGNLPRMMITMLLPYLFYFIWRFVEYRKTRAIYAVIIIMCLITLCHAMIAAMTGITAFIFLLIYSISQRSANRSFQMISAMLLSFALCGVWLYPALKGGLLGMAASNSEVMQNYSTPIAISLNPMLRNSGGHELFYFGLSILLLSIMGLFLANKKSRPGFYTVIIVFFGTTTAIVPFLEKLPLNQLFWMTRFTPIVYAVFLLSLLEWKRCRRYAVIALAIVIILDCVPSMDFHRYRSQASEIMSDMFSEVKEITGQRISLLDVSALGSYPSYAIASAEPRVGYTFGWAFQGASNSNNIVMLNTALEKGFYYYLFDRSLELGDDTVLVHKELVAKAKKTLGDLEVAASASGYKLYKEANLTYIFHRNTPKTFGVATEYSGLAIGRSAKTISLGYPSFEEGISVNVDDYTFEELARYKVLYLSAFTYRDKAAAEKLLTRAANTGVKVIIDMNQVPVDPTTSRMTFFDVTAQSITFKNQYPELMFRGKIYEAKPFKEEYSTWNTVYLENVDEVIGYSWFKSKELPFIAKAGNKNITFVGYNFLYHAMETNDKDILSLMTELLQLEPNQLPEREIVPLKIVFQEDKIIIDSPGGKVNTTLSYQDNFRSEQEITNQNNLLIIEKSHTEIKIVYPYLVQGLGISTLGLLGIALLMYFIYREKRYAQ